MVSRATDIATNLEIAAKVGIAPSGLADPQNSEFYAGGIDGISRDLAQRIYDHFHEGASE